MAWAHSPENNRAPGMTCSRACGGLAEGAPWLVDGLELADLPAALLARCGEQRTVYLEDWLGTLWQMPGATTPADFIARGWDECVAVLDRLVAALARPDDGLDACLATGEGWIAEEALATGLYCAIRHADNPVRCLVRAARTSGDSDSIAALAGAFTGAAWPTDWIARIKYTDQLAALTSGTPKRN